MNISYGPGRIQSVGLCTKYTNEILALDQETVATQFKIDLGLAELHNVRDSVAPRSYVDSRSQAFSDSWAWLQG